MPEQTPKVKVALELVVEVNAEAWGHLHNGAWKLNQATALAYVMAMFEADAKGTGVTAVTHLEASDPETGNDIDEARVCPECGGMMDEGDDEVMTCPTCC